MDYIILCCVNLLLHINLLQHTACRPLKSSIIIVDFSALPQILKALQKKNVSAYADPLTRSISGLCFIGIPHVLKQL